MLYRNYGETKLKDIKIFILSEILLNPRKTFDFFKVWYKFLIFFEANKERELSHLRPLFLI